MFRFSLLLLTALSFLVSQSWACNSQETANEDEDPPEYGDFQKTLGSVDDENFLIEDEDYGDYEQSISSRSISVNKKSDIVKHCRIEVMTVTGQKRRYAVVNCNVFP